MRRKPVLLVSMLIALVLVAGLICHLIIKYTPTKKRMDLYEYYGEVEGDEAASHHLGAWGWVCVQAQVSLRTDFIFAKKLI